MDCQWAANLADGFLWVGEGITGGGQLQARSQHAPQHHPPSTSSARLPLNNPQPKSSTKCQSPNPCVCTGLVRKIVCLHAWQGKQGEQWRQERRRFGTKSVGWAHLGAVFRAGRRRERQQ